MAHKNKRNQIPIDVKCKILAEIYKNKVSKSEVARKFGNQKSTLFTILKNRDKTWARNEAVSQNPECVQEKENFLF